MDNRFESAYTLHRLWQILPQLDKPRHNWLQASISSYFGVITSRAYIYT